MLVQSTRLNQQCQALSSLSFALDVEICFGYNQVMHTIKKGKVLCPIDFEDISNISYNDIIQNLLSDKGIEKNKPIGICQIDPRTNNRIIYSEARARRPHDTGTTVDTRWQSLVNASMSSCVVCMGKTTSIIDMAETSEGYTFINKNLFPV